jgi:hypothetical protein
MVTIGFKSRSSKLFRDLEQGACFTHAYDAEQGDALYMKINRVDNLNCIYLATGRATFVAPEVEVMEFNVDMTAAERRL